MKKNKKSDPPVRVVKILPAAPTIQISHKISYDPQAKCYVLKYNGEAG